MKILKNLTLLLMAGLFSLSASAQTVVIAQNNGTIDQTGPKGSPWYHNSQGPGDFASYGISTFLVTPDLFEGPLASIDEITISYTQANASFTTDGAIEFYVTFDPDVETGDYAGLMHSGAGTGIDDTQFSDMPSTQSLGVAAFAQVDDGQVDTYILDLSSQHDAILSAIAESQPFSILICAPDAGTAATYAGIQSNSYPDSITLSITASTGSTGVPVDYAEIAIQNGTISASGPSGSPWYHNAQGPGDYAQYGVSSFNLSPEDLGGDLLSIEELSISYTQANASFTADGPLELFVSFDSSIDADGYTALMHSGSGNGVNDDNFSDAPSTQSVGTFTFTQVDSGTVDTYVLDLSTQHDALLAAVNSGQTFNILVTAADAGTAITYAGIQNNSYPDSIIIGIKGIVSNSGSGGEESALMITGVMDGSLPGGLPKGIELFALADIPDLSIYGIGSANNGGGTDGEELTLSGSATAGDFIYIASEETEFMNVWGMAPDFVSDAAGINGDDAIELFMNGEVVDLFGEIDVDGNGTAWEYLDSWAYRTAQPGPDGTFVVENWTFGGVDALDDLDAAGIAAAVPFMSYAILGPGSPEEPILIDFGNVNSESGWNSVNADSVAEGPLSLVDASGGQTLVNLSVVESWNGTNNNGLTTGLDVFNADATADSLFGNDVLFGDKVAPNPTFEISGLNPEEPYTFTVFAARLSTSDNRTAVYTVTGDTVVSGELNPSNNETDILTLYNVMPTPAGTLVLDFKKADSNDNGSGFIYLGAVTITEGFQEIILPPVDPSIVISGVMDATLPGGLPKAIELYVFNDIEDLSRYGIGAANNGGGTDGVELVLEGSATAGTYLYVASDETEFMNVWGFAPDFIGDAANINGDDAVELFLDEEVIDVFGLIDVDGTDQPWEYTDGWAYKTTESGPNNGTFAIEEWTFSGVDALEDLDAMEIAETVPFGYYPNPIPQPEPLPWESTVSGDFVISPWFGAFEVSEGDWLNHTELIWIYVGYITDVEDMWIYSLWLNSWTWSSMDYWPWLYDTATSSWVYYFNVPNVGVWEYDTGVGDWTFYPAG